MKRDEERGRGKKKNRHLFQRDPLGLGDEKVDIKEADDEHAKEDEHDQGSDPNSKKKKTTLSHLASRVQDFKMTHLATMRGEKKESIKFQNQSNQPRLVRGAVSERI